MVVAVYDHCIIYAADMEFDDYPAYRGAIFDNQNTPAKLIEPKDREDVCSARAVFKSLFPKSSRVFATRAWIMHTTARYQLG